jgi:hypothetical protein
VNRLVEEIIKPILEANGIKKVIGIYGGRFQPFGPHHLKTYKWLQSKVDEAYITTSNIKKPPRHPMNFKEKVRHMSKMGVKSKYIIEEKSPYVAKNLEKKYDKKTTAFVYVFGAKDAGRLGGGGKYFQDYLKNKKNLKGYGENGYYLVAPHVSISVGGKEVSGTTMRELLGSDKFDDKQRAKLFKKMFGYFNDGVFQMMVNKFKKLFEMNESLPNKVTDKYKKMKISSPTDKKKFKQFLKHHQYHSGPHIDGLEAEPETYDFDDSSDSKAGVQKRKKDKIKRGWEPVKENDVVTWDNTKEKPKNKKHFDGEDRDLLHDVDFKKAIKKLKIPNKLLTNKNQLVKYLTSNPQMLSQLIRLATEDINEDWFKKGSKKDRALKLQISKLYSKAFKQMPGSPNQKKIQKEIEKLRNQLSEDIKLPINIGDTVRMGKFKNKKVVIKTMDWNEKGDLLINGRPALKFRIEKSKEIDEFLIHTDMSKLLEVSNTANAGGIQGVDSGPSLMFKNAEHYKGRGNQEAEKLGWTVINYILQNNSDDLPPSEYEMLDGWPIGPHNSVSYLPAGIGTGVTPNNQENLTGVKGYNKWFRAMKTKAEEVGYELMKFTKQDKDIKKQIAKDTVDTIKQQEKEEVEENVFTKDWWKKELLNEGGAYGHMAHPFDDKDLTFGDLKKIIENGLGGTLSREDGVTEKLDGQNIMISWKDGKLIAARNKGHIKNGGKTALDTKGIISKFKGRGDIKDAFVFAMKDLEKAIKSLSDKQKEKIFNNGYNFMNLEVMWPKSENVVNYDKAELVFHGALVYDDKGNVKGEVKGSGRVLAGMIKQRNQNIQKKYKIGKPVFLDVPKHQDFGTMKSKFIGELNKLRNQYGLKDNDTLGLYHQSYWEEYIYNAAQQFNYDITDDILENLTKRWAFFDKSYKIPTIRKELKDESEFLEWVLKTDKENHAKMVKENMKPFEELFFGVGAEILKNVKGFMAANPDKSVQSIRKKLKTSIENVKASGNKNKLNTLKLQLDKLNKIGGVDAIVPSEGIVFKYKGKTYKFTGAFAPINQITGLIYF